MHLFSSSAHSYACPDPWLPLRCPSCPADALAFCPFYAWTCAIWSIRTQSCCLTNDTCTHDTVRHVFGIIPTSYAWGSLSWSGRSCHRYGSSGRWEPLLPQWELQDQKSTPATVQHKSQFQCLRITTQKANEMLRLCIPTIWLGYSRGKALIGVPNTVLPLMKAFMMKLVTVWWQNKEAWDDEKILLKRKENKAFMSRGIKTETNILFLDRPAPRLWFRSKGSIIRESNSI